MEAAFRYRGVPASVSIARQDAQQFIASLPISTENALVVVSELLSNAVRHSTEPISLRLTWNGRSLRIEVSDADPRVERVTKPPPSPDIEHGRGLALTDHLAASWGAHELRDGRGKTVWATID
jgi:anti-sigma regulatory factor (Ser/Thr protein kinase)